MLLNIPHVQRQLASYLSRELSEELGSTVEIGNIEVGLFNRIMLENLQLYDQEDTEMLQVARMAARFDILPLFQGKISINNIQLYGFDAFLRKEDLDSAPNFQFLLDAFAKKETTQQENNLNLRINSVLLRRGNISYDLQSADSTPG